MTFNNKPVTGSLRPKELEAVYAISRAVAQSMDVDSALDDIIHLSRPVFIFDSMVLYLSKDPDILDASYARLIGRGQSADGELAWGDSVAYECYKNNQVIIRREETTGWEKDRLGLHFFLGLPLRQGESLLGSLVFSRFGGPPYTQDQIHLAEFIAIHVSQLLSSQQLVERIASLEAERKLDQLQKDFIATISHELCTPLGFIKGYATTLLREDATWDEATRREFLQIIDEEADRLRELIDNLLDSSRLQSGTMKMELQTVRLDSLLKDISVRSCSRNKDLAIELDIKKPDLRCKIDPTRIAQVLDNLLNNALKYAPGSPVMISLDLVDSKAHIVVKDKGPGISTEHMEHLFKRFYRVPGKTSAIRGTGLGLFICRQIITAHGGEITVESTAGEGTAFHIYIPCIQIENISTQIPQEAPA
jgi:signal transduction histidine kinase